MLTRQQQIAYDLCRSGAELRNRVLRRSYEDGLAGRKCPNTVDRTSPGYAAWLAGQDDRKQGVEPKAQ